MNAHYTAVGLLEVLVLPETLPVAVVAAVRPPFISLFVVGVNFGIRVGWLVVVVVVVAGGRQGQSIV